MPPCPGWPCLWIDWHGQPTRNPYHSLWTLLGDRAPLQVRPKLVWDNKHIKVILVQLNIEARRTRHDSMLADLSRAAFGFVMSIRYRPGTGSCLCQGLLSPARLLGLPLYHGKKMFVAQWTMPVEFLHETQVVLQENYYCIRALQVSRNLPLRNCTSCTTGPYS
jgi:hypothetical protein